MKYTPPRYNSDAGCTRQPTCRVSYYKKLQGAAKERLRGIYTAPSRKDALKALDTFEDLFGGAYEKALTCLRKDQEELLSFYQFPPEH